jgi:Integrase zinc binding domain
MKERQASADWLDQVRAGYQEHPMFAKPECLKELRCSEDGLVIPDVGTLHRDIMHEGHDVLYSGHFGVNKTVHSLQRFFWGPSLRADALACVRTCATCQRDKPSNKPPAGLLQPLPIPARRWERVSLDLIVELPPTARGYNAIVVFVDAHS